ncbi:MAG: tetratricopeptide repeat protein [Micromonosporaceae bacterium]|nr:tetratricopeptide repeat protein [Micromonosporaceae bacterium]
MMLDQARYLFRKGDYLGSRDLAQIMADRWSRELANGGLGIDHEQTLLAYRHLGNALRMTGEHGEARRLDQTAFDRLRSRPDFGDTHEHTVAVALGLGYDLSMAGDLEGALRSDQDNLRRAIAVHGPEHDYTRRAKDNVATQLRQVGRYAEALELSTQLVDEHTRIYGYEGDRALYLVSERAKDLLGLGRYLEAMDTLAPALDLWRQSGDRPTTHHRFNADRTWAILLYKTGRLDQAANEARSAYRSLVLHLGADHDNALAAHMTYANCLRARSDLHSARQEAMLAVEGHRRKFDADHRFRLVAEANLAIVLRKLGEDRSAYKLTRNSYERLCATLGEEHPYALAAAANYSGCLMWAHETDEARSMRSSAQWLGFSVPIIPALLTLGSAEEPTSTSNRQRSSPK